ncbi:MAG: hypothetical protein EKK40_03945 [Bradyrhizobiaceae bacterium]|nr:MAG: hypothetical protein EKK40_03945 [Bradyrhizobiaceae bacterium]
MTKSPLTLLLAGAMLAGASTAVLAQASGAVGTGPATRPSGGAMQSPVTTSPGATTTSPGMTTGSSAGTGLNTGSVNQPGVPNTSTPGSIGTGASPSGLPGDSATSPGYPGAVGGAR